MHTPKGWQQQDNHLLSRTFTFDHFDQTSTFVANLIKLYGTHDHHPDTQFGWGYVQINTTTHDAGNTLTERDVLLAEAINKLIS